jgi:hypothetical protein
MLNVLLEQNKSSKLFPQGVVVDVGDGCRPGIATVVGKNISYSDFRASFVKATIVPLLRTASVRTSNLPVGCSDTLRPVPDK